MGIGKIKDKNVLYPDIVAQCKDNIEYGGYNTMREFVDDFTTRILKKAEQEANPETQQKLKKISNQLLNKNIAQMTSNQDSIHGPPSPQKTEPKLRHFATPKPPVQTSASRFL